MPENNIPDLLIISQGSAFIVNSLENNIRKSGVYVTQCEPTVRDFDRHIAGMDMVLLFLGDYIKDSSGLLSYMSSKCADECIPFCVAGYPNEIAELEKLVDVSRISMEFPRPFDMKDFASHIRAMVLRESAEDKSEQSAAVPNEKHHILFCDDDMMFLKMVQEWLSESYRVTIVKTGLMAVPFALNHHPELILLDYEMPVMNGPKVLEALREDKNTAQIPVVFLTGHSDRDSVMEVMKLRPQGYLLKSTKKEDLIASIDNFFITGQWKNVQV